MDVMVNENAVSIPKEVSTWGDLFDWLETDYFKAGQCIIRVAVDGEEALDYRSADIFEQPLDSLGRIDVESSEFDKVVVQALEEFDQELDVALETNANVIRLLEARNEQQGYTALGKLLNSIRVFFAISSEDLGWADPKGIEIPRGQIPTMIERALSQIIAAQESRSWLLLCDILQYEVTPILESWKAIVRATRETKNT
jgi:hypothetical protein